MFHVTVNTNSIIQNEIQIKNEIINHVNVSVKLITLSKDIILGTLAHVFVRITNT